MYDLMHKLLVNTITLTQQNISINDLMDLQFLVSDSSPKWFPIYTFFQNDLRLLQYNEINFTAKYLYLLYKSTWKSLVEGLINIITNYAVNYLKIKPVFTTPGT